LLLDPLHFSLLFIGNVQSSLSAAMHFATIVVLISAPLLGAAATTCTPGECHFVPSKNASVSNYPGATKPSTTPLYDLNTLSSVPIATVCSSSNSTADLACARNYIDAIDEQLAFLYARRLGYAAVAGAAKFRAGTDLNDPTRNQAVAAGMAARVVKYGGNAEAGQVLGGEGCMIYASLIYEVEQIQENCNPAFEEDVERVCT
jgi:chorismate mutase